MRQGNITVNHAESTLARQAYEEYCSRSCRSVPCTQHLSLRGAKLAAFLPASNGSSLWKLLDVLGCGRCVLSHPLLIEACATLVQRTRRVTHRGPP